jgi:hypothetical protein
LPKDYVKIILRPLIFQKITTKLARINLAAFYKDLLQIFYDLLAIASCSSFRIMAISSRTRMARLVRIPAVERLFYQTGFQFPDLKISIA